MAVRLRLRRMGKKKKPFYRIVAIDGREARQGKYLENLGYYNPVPQVTELEVKVDRALYWLQNGAQPSDTVRSLFRKKGVMLRYSLLKNGKSTEEIDSEVKKWETLQEERFKRLEAEKIQKEKSAQTEKKKEAPKSEPVVAEAEQKDSQEEQGEEKVEAVEE